MSTFSLKFRGGGCSDTQNTPPIKTALTGSVATVQRRSQSGRLQDPGDRGIDQSISDSAQSGIGVLRSMLRASDGHIEQLL